MAQSPEFRPAASQMLFQPVDLYAGQGLQSSVVNRFQQRRYLEWLAALELPPYAEVPGEFLDQPDHPLLGEP